MPVALLFYSCMFSALKQSYALDLSVYLAFVLFRPRWRAVAHDIKVILLSCVLLQVLDQYTYWRSWHPVSIDHDVLESLSLLRNELMHRIQAGLSGNYGAFINAVFLGAKKGLSADTTNLFRQWGMSHVLAISGFHIGFWIVLMRPFFWWARSIHGLRCAHIVQLTLLYLYALLVGASASVLRAVWMFGLSRWSRIHQYRTPSLHFPAAVAVGHFFVNPKAPTTVSFQLSYAAVFAILFAMRKTGGGDVVLEYSFASLKKPLSWLLTPVQLSLAAWSATLPLVQATFGGASPYFLISNVFLVPIIVAFIWCALPVLLLGSHCPMVYLNILETAWCHLLFLAQEVLLTLHKLR